MRVEVERPCLRKPPPAPYLITVYSPTKPMGTVRCDPPFEACLTEPDAKLLERHLRELAAWARDAWTDCKAP